MTEAGQKIIRDSFWICFSPWCPDAIAHSIMDSINDLIGWSPIWSPVSDINKQIGTIYVIHKVQL
jgi:hypothetical protein